MFCLPGTLRESGQKRPEVTVVANIPGSPDSIVWEKFWDYVDNQFFTDPHQLASKEYRDAW